MPLAKKLFNHRGGPTGLCPPIFLCWERRYPKQNGVICLKSNSFATSQTFCLATLLCSPTVTSNMQKLGWLPNREELQKNPKPPFDFAFPGTHATTTDLKKALLPPYLATELVCWTSSLSVTSALADLSSSLTPSSSAISKDFIPSARHIKIYHYCELIPKGTRSNPASNREGKLLKKGYLPVAELGIENLSGP